MRPTTLKDRLIVLTALGLVAVLLAGAAALTPSINRTRRTLQLTANDQLVENLPPAIAFSQAALGSFRGLIVDILWARANQMQQDGQVYEAMQLADWITKFQPRFAEVWRFHAWNMSYNISVMTHTPTERWMWVRAGVDLLRDEGIPLNPNSVMLYRELSYIFMHKIGQYTDEMHEYYKKALAREWHEVLGPPPLGDTGIVIEHFRPIAEVYDRYINRMTPDAAGRAAVDALIAARPDLAAELADLPVLSLNQLDIEIDNLRERRARADDADFDGQSRPVRDAVTDQLRRMARPSLDRLVEDHPGAAAVFARITAMGQRPDGTFLKRLQDFDDVRRSEHIAQLGLVEPEAMAAQAKPYRDFLDDPAIAADRDLVMAYIRASVLSDRYHMDPTWMLTLMEGKWFVTPDQKTVVGEGEAAMPIDWRHPMAHALYWGSMGVRRSRGAVNVTSIESLNTDRVALSALQGLTFSGQITFDPVSNYYRVSPDVRYIEPFNKAVFGALVRVKGTDGEQGEYDDYIDGTVAHESYQSWHEYFLTWAVQTYFFYGYRDKAEEYYRTLRELYYDYVNPAERQERYTKPLEQFVYDDFVNQDNLSSIDDVRTVVNSLLFRAFNEGYAAGDQDVADLCLSWAEKLHGEYQKIKNFSNSQQAEGIEFKRQMLPPFDDMVAEALLRFLTYPSGGSISLSAKSRVWARAKETHKRMIWDLANGPIYQQTRTMGVDPRHLFPEPSGMAEYRATHPQRVRPAERPAGSAPIVR